MQMHEKGINSSGKYYERGCVSDRAYVLHLHKTPLNAQLYTFPSFSVSPPTFKMKYADVIKLKPSENNTYFGPPCRLFMFYF